MSSTMIPCRASADAFGMAQPSIIRKIGDTLPFCAATLFDIAADIERYPEFLRGWNSARVIARCNDTLTVIQDVGIGPMRFTFTSKALLRRPHAIDITSIDNPFTRLQISWVISPLSAERCQMSVTAEFTMRSPLLQALIDHLLPALIADQLGAFRNRALALHPTAPHFP